MTRARRQRQLARRVMLFLVVCLGTVLGILYHYEFGQRVEGFLQQKSASKPESVETLAEKTDALPTVAASSASTGQDDSTHYTSSAASPPKEDGTASASERPMSTPTEEEIRAAEEYEHQHLLSLDVDELGPILRERDVPEDLVAFMEEYPETKEFVVNYLYRPKEAPDQDVSGEVEQGVIPHFLQWDERWGYDMYDDSYFAVAGCGPTALSEVYCGLTGKTDLNPYEMGEWATEQGYHVRGQGTSWEMMDSGAQQLGLWVWGVEYSEDAILGTLRGGNPIICAVSPGDFTHFGHFIVLASADEEGNITVRDSNSIVRTERTWTADELLWQVASMWAYAYVEEE